MGSRLYSRGEVQGLLARSELELVAADHDFVLPYGLYRQTPNALAEPLRSLDRAVGRLPGGRRLASVSWWQARVAGGDSGGRSRERAATERHEGGHHAAEPAANTPDGVDAAEPAGPDTPGDTESEVEPEPETETGDD
jgi:hypothetical protein